MLSLAQMYVVMNVYHHLILDKAPLLPSLLPPPVYLLALYVYRHVCSLGVLGVLFLISLNLFVFLYSE